MSHRVDLDQLEWAITDLEAFERHLEREVAKLEALVAELSGSWSGDAATAHQQAHQLWTQGASRMRTALAQMRSAARTAHDNYGAAVAANLAMWQSLQ